MKKAHTWIDPGWEFHQVNEMGGQWVQDSESIDNSVVKNNGLWHPVRIGKKGKGCVG